jgi:hypothetical protein
LERIHRPVDREVLSVDSGNETRQREERCDTPIDLTGPALLDLEPPDLAVPVDLDGDRRSNP